MPEKTSEQWLKELNKGLTARQEAVTRYRNYYFGKHDQTYSTEKFRQRFGSLFAGLTSNFCGLVVDSVEERLNVEGFRYGGEETEEADKEAWRIWQANGLDADSQMLHRSVLTVGDGYVSIWANPKDTETPIISVEDPSQIVTVSAAGNRRQKLAGLKRWKDDSGVWFCTLYMPDFIYKFRSKAKTFSDNMKWERREVADEEWPLPNPLQEVPLVRFVNRPWVDGTGCSELAPIIPLQDGLNKLMADMLLAAEFAAFRQRWATGVEIPKDDNGEPIEPPASAVSRLWVSDKEGAHFGEFSESDLGNYVKAMETYIQQIASISKTPPHYLLGQSGSFPSGESLKATETGLVSKARDCFVHLGESWEDVQRISFKVKGDKRANVVDAETIWRDPESRTESEHVDAVMKMQAMGVPWEMCMEELGFSPQKIARMKRLRMTEQMLTGNVIDLQERAQRMLDERRQAAGISAGPGQPQTA